jgi:hypothetical protein
MYNTSLYTRPCIVTVKPNTSLSCVCGDDRLSNCVPYILAITGLLRGMCGFFVDIMPA